MRRIITALLTVSLALACSAMALSAPSDTTPSPPSNAQIAHKLDYLVNASNFSTDHPLSQRDLMKLALDLAWWDYYPDAYKASAQPADMDRCTGSITRANARKFIRNTLGADLRVWDSYGLTDLFTADAIGWQDSTANTMYARPHIKLGTVKTDMGGVRCAFQVTYQPGNVSDNADIRTVGSGRATLVKRGDHWVVIEWRVTRKLNWPK